MDKIGDFLKLNEIYECVKDNIMFLPTVQRGFVWKPHQIENLWDSLLRGYPIGSFVLSPKIDDPSKYELLDGQQRASAICLGFYNPLSDEKESPNAIRKFFNASTDRIMIFVDLVKLSTEDDNRKYLFRVITKSHPWGYRLRENDKTLRTDVRAKAIKAYELYKDDYLKRDLRTYWPFDAYDPIPIGIFVDAAKQNKNINELNKDIETWKKNKSLKVFNNRNYAEYYSIGDIYEAVKKMLENQKVPILHFDIRQELENTYSHKKLIPDYEQEGRDKTTNEEEDDTENEAPQNVEDREISEIENLFIRLNAGGTPLRGEELNYSILKAHISRELQEKIENKCKGLFNPARFITVSFRLYCNQGNSNATDKESIVMRIKPKEFQRRIQAEKEEFIKFLRDSLLNNYILDKIKSFLTYDPNNNKIGLPVLIVNSLADYAPEIVFLLLYRVIVKGDGLNEEIKKRILGMLTILAWLLGEKQKDYSKLLNSIWLCVKNFDTERFWSGETLQRCLAVDNNGYEILSLFPKTPQLTRLIPNKNENIRNFVWDKLTGDESEFGSFVRSIFYENNLILYAQRNALHEWFGGIDIYDLDDTNRVFDWDHICPADAIYRKKYVHRALKDWYSSNGNLRAWPFDLNRGDSNKPPSQKLICSADDVKWMAKRFNCSTKEVNEKLLKLSVCDKDWLEIDDTFLQYIRNTTYAKKILYCILKRNIMLCKEWYDALGIDYYFNKNKNKNETITFFLSIFDKRKWQKANRNEDDNRITYELPLHKEGMYLYIDFETGFNALKENNVEFGLWSDSPLNIRVPRRKEKDYISNGKKEIYGLFTLMSFSHESLIEIGKEFCKWLDKFPDKSVGQRAMHRFRESLKDELRHHINII